MSNAHTSCHSDEFKMLQDILPQDYECRFINSSVISDEEFTCEFRTKIGNGEEFLEWLKQFEILTNTSWNLRHSIVSNGKSSKFEFIRDYVCHHSSYHKKKSEGKDKKCTATLTVRIKKINKYTRCRDPLLKDGFCTIIKINHQHSHQINVPEAWNWLPRKDEIRQLFTDYFNAGMSPSDAKHYHQSILLADSPEQLENSRTNPPARWIYSHYQKWRAEHLGGPEFHSFPKDEKRRQLCDSKLKRKNFKATNSTKICSKPFTEDCFNQEIFERTWLENDAIPTIFEFPAEHLQPKEIERRQLKKRENDEDSEGRTPNNTDTIKKRKYYLGDYSENDMKSPTKAIEVLTVAKNQAKFQSEKIKDLSRKNKELEKKFCTVQKVLELLKQESLISETASDMLELSLV